VLELSGRLSSNLSTKAREVVRSRSLEFDVDIDAYALASPPLELGLYIIRKDA
jgi:hypothetical protein